MATLMTTAEHKRLRAIDLQGSYRLSYTDESQQSYPDYQVREEEEEGRHTSGSDGEGVLANQERQHYWLKSGKMTKNLY